MPSRRSLELDSSATTSSPSRALIELIRRPATWPDWQSEIKSIRGPEVAAAGDTVDGDAELLGFAVAGRSDVVESTEARFEEDVIVGVRMRISYEATATAGGTRIRRRMIADLPAGPAGRLLSFLLARRLKKMHRDVLRRLARYELSDP